MLWCLGLMGLLAWSETAAAAQDPPLELPAWTALPFALFLLCIALLPLVAEQFWHSNRNRALVALLFAGPVAAYLCYRGPSTAGASIAALIHELEQYVSFIVLLAALYTVSGGIVLSGDMQGKPLTNTAFLACGAVIANLVGTTGASMLLIRPVLRINKSRQHTRHLPIFFIFTVSNLGGLLTPLGDPPLFLGFLNGVDFTWTLQLWPQFLVANGIVLAVFFLWDQLAYRRESALAATGTGRGEPLRLRGLVNLLFLAGVLAAVLLQSPQVSGACRDWLGRFFACPDLTLVFPWGESIMVGMGLASLALTPRGLRQANGFGWGAIIEVAVLFAGIFVTMVPALALLRRHGASFGVTEPWEYFWLTGGLSGFLDNAPTYVALATLAAGEHHIGWLMDHKPLVLQAISCGAVFMGANTYIGNGPNFMVKAIADEMGFRMPSFFGYLLYSACVLLPVFGLVTVLFFL